MILFKGIPEQVQNELGQQPQGGAAAAGGGAQAPVAQQPAPTTGAVAPAPVQPAPAPTGNLFQQAQAAAQHQQPAGGAAGGRRGAAGAGGAALDIEAIRNSPMFGQIQQMVQQNPNLLQPLIQQLAASHPGLAHALAENPELLYQLLGGAGAGAGGQHPDLEGDDAVPPGAHVINVTPEERDAIDRVRSFEFREAHFSPQVYNIARCTWLLPPGGHRGVLCLWQERRTRRQFLVRGRISR